MFTFLFGPDPALPWIAVAAVAAAGTVITSMLRSRMPAAAM